MRISYSIQIKQLDYLYQLIQNSLKTRSMIKGWCITVWSAVAVIIIVQLNNSAESTLINENLFWSILSLPIVFFWMADSVERAREYLYKEQVKNIEKDIVSGKEKIESADELFIMSSYDKFDVWKKIQYCVSSSVSGETIWSFYPILIVFSFIFTRLI